MAREIEKKEPKRVKEEKNLINGQAKLLHKSESVGCFSSGAFFLLVVQNTLVGLKENKKGLEYD